MTSDQITVGCSYTDTQYQGRLSYTVTAVAHSGDGALCDVQYPDGSTDKILWPAGVDAELNPPA